MTNDEMAKFWFPTHIKEIHVNTNFAEKFAVEFLRWGNPGTCINRIDYLRNNHRLFVAGDLGEAIYAWSEIKSLEWMAGLNLDYFASKCQASETGREYFEWSEEKAKKNLDYYFTNWDEEEAAALKSKATEAGAYGTLHAENEWTEWLRESGYEVFGGEYYELGRIGRKISLRCQGHLLGLKMAFGLYKLSV